MILLSRKSESATALYQISHVDNCTKIAPQSLQIKKSLNLALSTVLTLQSARRGQSRGRV